MDERPVSSDRRQRMTIDEEERFRNLSLEEQIEWVNSLPLSTQIPTAMAAMIKELPFRTWEETWKAVSRIQTYPQGGFSRNTMRVPEGIVIPTDYSFLS